MVTYVRPCPKCAESYTVGPQMYHAIPRRDVVLVALVVLIVVEEEILVGGWRRLHCLAERELYTFIFIYPLSLLLLFLLQSSLMLLAPSLL